MKEKTYIKPKLNIIIDMDNQSNGQNDGVNFLNGGDIWAETSGDGFEGGMDE